MTIIQLTQEHALFLDIDGTLLDLAPTPDSVIIPPGLPELLRKLQQKLDGALAILSGRKLADIDHLLGPGLPCAAEHGMILRDEAGCVTHTARRPAAYAQWLKILGNYTESMPGTLIEEKQYSLVLHYRRAPQYEAELRQLAERLVADSTDTILLPAHCAFELRARGGGKADALASFMAHLPFTGRKPIFIGDDITDEPAIAKANELGGAGLHVARDFAGKTKAVREWLNQQ
jgi:trehalose 6-phosphate phosphatase